MPADQTLLLHADRPLRLDRARHAELRVEAGTVWITAGADDLFLTAGERYRLPRAGTVLVEALRGPARAQLAPAPARSLPALLDACRRWLPKRLATP